jgi:hypothetical protein
MKRDHAAIADVFAEALAIAGALEHPGPKPLRAHHPETLRGWGDYQQEGQWRVRLMPDPRLIDPAVEICLSWPGMVEHEDHRMVLFLKARGLGYAYISALIDKHEDTARRWHEKALADIASRGVMRSEAYLAFMRGEMEDAG